MSSTVRESSPPTAMEAPKDAANKKMELNPLAAEFVPQFGSRNDGKTSVSFHFFYSYFFMVYIMYTSLNACKVYYVTVLSVRLSDIFSKYFV